MNDRSDTVSYRLQSNFYFGADQRDRDRQQLPRRPASRALGYDRVGLARPGRHECPVAHGLFISCLMGVTFRPSDLKEATRPPKAGLVYARIDCDMRVPSRCCSGVIDAGQTLYSSSVEDVSLMWETLPPLGPSRAAATRARNLGELR